jgi:hypothetical protein
MKKLEKFWKGALAPALLLPLLAMLSPDLHASGGDPRLDGLRELVEEVGEMVGNPGLGENAEAVAKARDAAVVAIDAGRLHLALEKLVAPLEVGPGLIYRAAMTETIQDQATFEVEWRTQGTMIAEEQRREAAAKCPGAPAHVRAVAERSANRSAHYYDAARAMALATQPANGLFYLGRARGQFELQKICEQLSTDGTIEQPPVRNLTVELADLEERTAVEFARPDAGTEKHGQFIVLNATIKEILEMNEAGLFHGTLYEYLNATLQLGLLTDEPTGNREELSVKAAAFTERFKTDGIDHGIVLAFLEAAAADLENDDAEAADLASATVIVQDVAPAYAAVVGTMPKRPQPEVAAGQVAITLVRWPYT